MYPLTPTLLVLMVGAALLSGAPDRALGAVVGGAAAFAVLLLLALISPRGMGMGDVKLAGFIGIGLGYLSYGHVVVGMFGGFLVGALGGMLFLGLQAVRGGSLRRQKIPFGPYLAAGALLGLFFGGAVWNWYLGTLGVA
jgi:leader peptidase (prepilin peptidase)/N-methyltransferase